jgi:hypothetical protein
MNRGDVLQAAWTSMDLLQTSLFPSSSDTQSPLNAVIRERSPAGSNADIPHRRPLNTFDFFTLSPLLDELK